MREAQEMYATTKDDTWWDIYPTEAAVKMCGGTDIRHIKVIADLTGPYWGWWDAEQDKFSMIYLSKFLLAMCFPYGIRAEEEAGKGKALRFRIEEV